MDKMDNLYELSSRYNDTGLDFSYLKKIKPRPNDMLVSVDSLNIDAEIDQLQKEMSDLDLRSIPFDKYDFVLIFIAGLVGAACDIILGKPADGYDGVLKPAEEPKINNDFAFGLGKHLREYDLTNNPIDKNIPGAPVGDHRLYSYGHDLFRVIQTVKLMLTGIGPVGLSGLGGEVELAQAPEKWLEQLKDLGIDGSQPDAKAIIKILIVLFLHLYKDYCSARSLPLPGSTLITNLNKDTMPEFLDELTNEKELNLRTLNGQLLSVFSIELILSVYMLIRKKTDKGIYSDEQYKNKKDKVKLIAHSIALAFNIGKVVVTNNPAFLNFPQVIRIVKLGWNVIKAEIEINHKAIEKVNLSVLKNKYETAQTLILLDDSVYYTKEIDSLIVDMKNDFNKKNSERNKNISKGFDELDDMLRQLKAENQ